VQSFVLSLPDQVVSEIYQFSCYSVDVDRQAVHQPYHITLIITYSSPGPNQQVATLLTPFAG